VQGELQLSWMRVEDALRLRSTPYFTVLVGRHL
jgi:hypothetical protein